VRLTVVYTLKAQIDLVSLWEDYLPRGTTAADAALRVLVEQANELLTFPHMGRSREDLGPDLRSLRKHNRLLIYKLEDERIVIVRVVYARSDLSNTDFEA
jgi:plasmid stabilization system protein ParE